MSATLAQYVSICLITDEYIHDLVDLVYLLGSILYAGEYNNHNILKMRMPGTVKCRPTVAY